jgi:choline dehydrogenase-like flavoprotein
VLVVGGGTAGTIAAIQAGRAGASVLLVERGSQLGGTMTTGGVAFPGLFDAWGKQIIAGIGWELVKESVELDKGTLPDFAKVPQRHLAEPGLHQPVPLRDPRRGKMRQAGRADRLLRVPAGRGENR